MSRVQLALRVGDLEASVAFYSKLFGTEPAKLRPGYANFAIVEPPLRKSNGTVPLSDAPPGPDPASRQSPRRLPTARTPSRD